MRRLVPVLILAQLLALLLGGPLPARAAPAQALAVAVHGAGGAPVEGARVELLAAGSGIVATAVTDREGRAALAAPGGDLFWVRTWARGYAVTDQAWVPLADGPALALRLTASAGSVTGVVTGRGGLPVASAVVTAWRADQGLAARALTNQFGTYRLDGLTPPGPYTVQVEGRGHLPFAADAVSAEAGVTGRLDVALTPADGLVTGEAVSAGSGRPLAGARIAALRAGWGIIATADADDDGRFRLALPAADQPDYRLRIIAPGHDVLTGEPFALADGGWVSFGGPDRLAVQPLQAEVWGFVMDDDGRSLPEAEVELQRAGVGTVDRTRTDGDGFYIFPQVLPGDYRVRALPGPNRAPADSAWFTAAPGGQVAADLTARDLEVRQHGEGTIAGRVTGPGGVPVSGATLTLVRGQETVATAMSDSRGFYRLRGVPANLGDGDPGTGYLLRVAAAHFYVTDLPGGPQDRPVGLLDVRRDTVARADFQLHPAAAEVAGRVFDESGAPVAGAEVQLYRAGAAAGPIARTESAADGSYRFHGLPGAGGAAYWVEAAAEGHYIAAVDAGGAPVSPIDPAGQPGGAARLDLALHPSAGQVHGAVADGAGRPLAGVPVTAVRPADGASWTAQTDSDGWYVIGGVPAGPGQALLVRAEVPGAPLAAAPAAVALAGRRAANAHVRGAPTAAVAGTVYDAGGRPMAGAAVELWEEGWTDAVRRTVAGADGGYRFDGLVAGRRYTVVARAPGHVPTSLSPGEAVVTPLFTAEANATVRRHLSLVPEVDR